MAMAEAMGVLTKLMAAAVVLYALALSFLWFRQEKLLFAPAPIRGEDPLPSSLQKPDVAERFVDVPGARLSVLELRLPSPQGIVFFLHGNAGNNHSWAGDLDFYRKMNFDAAMLDYRGYGRSGGHIQSEEQLRSDVASVWSSMAKRYAGKRIVFMGRSMGTGLAAGLAAQLPATEQPSATILISPYSSMVDMASLHYPWVPSALLRYPLRTDLLLKDIKGPVLLIHGDQDELIPVAHSQVLKSILPSARLEVITGAGHGDLQDIPHYFDVIRSGIVNR
jgi:uncharacterized protein